MSPWAADFSWAQLNAAQLKAAGYSGAIRYITGDGKQITPAEFRDLTMTPGMSLALVNETGPQAAQGGYPIGRAEAQAAFARADALGWPPRRPIYFVGEDPNWKPLPWAQIEAYFRGVCSVVPAYRVGDYGSPDQVAHIMGLGLAAFGWAVETWPGNPSGCHLRQMYNPVPGAPHNFGGQVDPDMILKIDWGQWSLLSPVPSTGPLPPLPNPTQPRPAPPTKDDPMITTDLLRPNQIDTFHVDNQGRLVHHWFIVDRMWMAEILATGAIPRGDLALNTRWAGDGMAHLFAEAPGGGQIHRYWDGDAWHSDQQEGPA